MNCDCNGTGAVDAPFSGDDPCCPECDGEGTGDETVCDLRDAPMALLAGAARKTPLARDELGMLKEINSVLGRIIP